MKHHQRSSIGNATIEEYMKREFDSPKSFSSLLYLSQILQADGIRLGIEAHRRNKNKCMGSIYWQLNDCWPGASWSSIDYYGKWKALHYKAKNSFEESILSFHKKSDEVDVYFVTDKLESQKLKFNVQLIDFSGKIHKSWNGEFFSEANNSKIIHKIKDGSALEYFLWKTRIKKVTFESIQNNEKIYIYFTIIFNGPKSRQDDFKHRQRNHSQ